MKVNRLGVWLVVGAMVAACSAQTANIGGSGDDGGSGDGSTDSSTGSSSGSASGSGSGSSSGAGSSSGSGSGSSSGTDSGGSSGSSSGGPVDAGPDANCGSIPILHPDQAGTLFCGYGADGGALDCTQSSGDGVCCLGGEIAPSMFAPQMCASAPAGCTNGGSLDAGQTPAIPIACYQVADCTGAGFSGSVACCLQGGTPPSDQPGCTYPRVKGGTAVVCEGTAPSDGGSEAGTGAGATGTCGLGEVQICSQQSDCPTGTTCTPGKWKIFDVGFCM